MPLVLTRRVDEVLRIGDDVVIKILGVKGNQVRLGIEAPRSVAVHREEIYQRIRSEAAELAGARPLRGTLDEIAGRPLEDARYGGNGSCHCSRGGNAAFCECGGGPR